MAKRKLDGKFIDFPLCCLIYVNGQKESLRDIMQYCVFQNALNMGNDPEIEGRIACTDFDFMTAADFDNSDILHLEIALASQDLGIQIHSFQNLFEVSYSLKKFIHDYETNHGKDAYCRMGKDLTLDVIHGRFELREYLILCAIQSILGKEKLFARITSERISYRMHGYKSRKIFKEEKPQKPLFTERQIQYSVNKLYSYGLINYFTFQRRVKYYSTKLKGDKLMIAFRDYKIAKFKNQKGIQDSEWSRKIMEDLDHLKSNYNAIHSGNNKLRLVKRNTDKSQTG